MTHREGSEPLAEAWRQHWPRLVALLVGQFRRLELAEDALADAFEAAARTWPERGAPENPAGWLLATARRRALDRIRAEAVAARKQRLLVVDAELQARAVRADPGDLVGDETLRLVLMCAHPTLAPESAAALSLRLVLGVPTADIARLFLVPHATMSARLTRARRRLVALGVPLAVPRAGVLPQRVGAVADVAYLAFTAGYAPSSGADVLRVHTAGESIRLVRVTLDGLPGDPTLMALLALMLLQHSRRDARVDGAGRPVLLPDQDRSAWHHDEIAEALAILTAVMVDVDPSADEATRSYLLQALIAAEHARARQAEDTDWHRVAELYAALDEHTGSPVVRLNRAVALAEAEGADAGLALLDGLDDRLADSHRLPAARAALLERAGRVAEALQAYDVALDRCGNDAERRHLEAQVRRLAGANG